MSGEVATTQGNGRPAVLQAWHLSRWYGQVIGINDISCELRPGVTGLLGLNGAGKSTLFKVLAGMIRPSKGEVRVHGLDLAQHPGLYRRIGYCPEPDALYEAMTGREMLVYLLRLHGIGASEARERATDALRRTHLEDAADRRVGGYSKGMRQKIKLAQAMSHDPDVLFLDEPFNGMDPESRHEALELIRELGQAGKTVVVSSHILHEVEAMTSNILLIHNGRILAEGDVRDIREVLQRHPHQVRVECRDPRALGAVLLAGDEVTGVEVEASETLLVHTNMPRHFFRRLPEAAVASGAGVRGWTTLDDNLKSLFEYLVEG